MGRTNVLVAEQAQVGDGEMSQAAGIDDHLARTVTPERRAAVVQRWSRGSGCEDRVADERDVLDTQVLAALQELEQRSQAGLLAHLITVYLQEAPARIAALHEAVAHGDAGRVEEVAHGLKGSSAELGAPRMASLCAALQEAAGAHDLSQTTAQVAELTNEFMSVRTALEAVLPEGGPSSS
jgi:HPt (histidine-containing phosphotransfer) domain-containing protein